MTRVPVWVRMCFCRSPEVLNDLVQFSSVHRYGFSPVCVRTWLFNPYPEDRKRCYNSINTKLETIFDGCKERNHHFHSLQALHSTVQNNRTLDTVYIFFLSSFIKNVYFLLPSEGQTVMIIMWTNTVFWGSCMLSIRSTFFFFFFILTLSSKWHLLAHMKINNEVYSYNIYCYLDSKLF